MVDTATEAAVAAYEWTNDTSGSPLFANLSSPSSAAESTVAATADDDGGFPLLHQSLLLWLPHASIACLLVLLVAVSFVRFHNKHGHRYRKSAAERAAASSAGAVTVARNAWTGDAAAATSPPVAERHAAGTGEDDYLSAASGSDATRALFSVWTLRRGRVVGDVVSSLPKAIAKPVRIGSTADECHELLLEKL